MIFLYSGNKENGTTEKDGEKKETSAEKRKRVIFFTNAYGQARGVTRPPLRSARMLNLFFDAFP